MGRPCAARSAARSAALTGWVASCGSSKSARTRPQTDGSRAFNQVAAGARASRRCSRSSHSALRRCCSRWRCPSALRCRRATLRFSAPPPIDPSTPSLYPSAPLCLYPCSHPPPTPHARLAPQEGYAERQPALLAHLIAAGDRPEDFFFPSGNTTYPGVPGAMGQAPRRRGLRRNPTQEIRKGKTERGNAASAATR